MFRKLLESKINSLKKLVCLGPIIIPTHGDSMEDTIKSGEYVEIANKEYRKGSIILFYKSDSYQLILHRIIDVKSNVLIAKGDNELLTDSLEINGNQIIGVFTRKFPKHYIENILRENEVTINNINEFNFHMCGNILTKVTLVER